MVLGFGSKKKRAAAEPIFIRASPSLPELAQQRIPWPKNLIDSDVVYESVYASPPGEGHPGARKTSFQANRGPAIPFHKPFRAGGATTPDSPTSAHMNQGSLAPPSAFNGVGGRSRAGSHPLSQARSTRRAKNPPTFNVMVAGAKHTGKSSLLRLILDTSTLSPMSTQDQLKSLSAFRSSSIRPTGTITAACVEILQPPPPGRPASLEDRITLTCIDTPGLDFSEGKEFALDRDVSGIVRYLDLQFAETLGEERKVVRASKGDQHVHLCIYLIDPDSVMTPSARRAKTKLSAALRGYPPSASELPEPSEYDSGSDDDLENDISVVSAEQAGVSENGHGTVEHGQPPVGIAPGEEAPQYSADPTTPVRTPKQDQLSQLQTPPRSQTSHRAQNKLAMAPAEIRVISRLAKRVNVLPVVARSDTLTDGRLERIKRAVRRDLQPVGIGADEENEDIGIFAVWDAEPGALFGRGAGKENGAAVLEDPEDPDGARPVIKLRDRGQGRGLTRSRSRRSLKAAVGAEYETPESGAQQAAPASAPDHADDISLMSPPSRRTSAASAPPGVVAPMYNPKFSRAELRARIPFALIAPERERPTRPATAASSQNGHALEAPAHDMKGRFVRRFRWGTVDVLDPQHCDFAALRTAVLCSYMRALKATTKDVLYERFRTEKLLVRRATQNITPDDRKRILRDLEL